MTKIGAFFRAPIYRMFTTYMNVNGALVPEKIDFQKCRKIGKKPVKIRYTSSKKFYPDKLIRTT